MAFIYFRREDVHTSPSGGSWYANEDEKESERQEENNRESDRNVNGLLHSRAMRSVRKTTIEKKNRDLVQAGRGMK